MRLATANVLHGARADDREVATGALARALVALDADVLALQEVERGQERSHRTDQAELAALALGAASWRFLPAVVGRREEGLRRADGSQAPDEPGYGVALVSRHPVSAWREVRLPLRRLPAAVRTPAGLRWTTDEPRVALLARVEAPGGPVTAVCTHLSVVPGQSRLQLRALAAVLAEVPGPLVLMGDLNGASDAAAQVTGLQPLARGLTFPADRPDRQLDHLLGRGVRPAGPGGAVVMPVSDHRALVADVVVDGTGGGAAPVSPAP